MINVRRIPLGIALMMLTAFAAADDERLGSETLLFGPESGPPLHLDSERGWTHVTALEMNSFPAAAPDRDSPVRWRLRSSYEHGYSVGPATLQIRIRGPESTPTFTHPWSEGADRNADSFSNWFTATSYIRDFDGRGIVEARLVAPPRTPLTGTLYAVTLEFWIHDDSIRPASGGGGPDVQLAYARPLPISPLKMESQTVAPASGADTRTGLDFALSFVDACITGDLPAYYRAQADPVRSLDDGSAIPKYRLSPPRGISGISGIDEYRRRFDYRLYDHQTILDLFPQWFDGNRPWTPSENALLFMGHRDRITASPPEGVDYLVFLIEPDAEGRWQVVARPGH